MTDRNLDYDYASKQRKVTEEQNMFGRSVEAGYDGEREFVWTPPTGPSDGTAASWDGSEAIWAFSTYLETTDLTYETRDSRRVIRSVAVPTAWYHWTVFAFWGPDIPRKTFDGPGWEFRIVAYINLAYFDMVASDGSSGWTLLRCEIDTSDGVGTLDIGMSGGVVNAATGKVTNNNATLPSTAGWAVDDWYELGIKIDTDGKVYGMIKPEANADDWRLVNVDPWPEQAYPSVLPVLKFVRAEPEDPTSVFDFWKFQYRRIN